MQSGLNGSVVGKLVSSPFLPILSSFSTILSLILLSVTYPY